MLSKGCFSLPMGGSKTTYYLSPLVEQEVNKSIGGLSWGSLTLSSFYCKAIMTTWNNYKYKSFQIKQVRGSNPYIMKHPECCGVMILADLYGSPEGWGDEPLEEEDLSELLEAVDKQAYDDNHRRSIIQLFLNSNQNREYSGVLKKHGYTCFISFINRNTASTNYGYIKDLTKVKKPKTKRMF
jgi:hypothetical protein